MIVNKRFEDLKITVNYEVRYDGLASEDEVFEEYMVVKNFAALMHYLGDYGINKIREKHENADSIKVSGIIITSEKQEDSSMTVQLFGDKAFNAWVTTKIENDDIESRLMTNIKQVKRIVDNTLNEYPVKY